MSALPVPLALPEITQPFYKSPYAGAVLPNAARKVWACLMFHVWRGKLTDGRITLTDRMGSRWCTARFGEEPFGNGRYGSTGRRCWQKGLQQLERIGWISRHRQHGGRTITITIQFPAAEPKAPAKSKPRPAARRAAPQPMAPPAPHVARDQPAVADPIPPGFDWRKAAAQEKAIPAGIGTPAKPKRSIAEQEADTAKKKAAYYEAMERRRAAAARPERTGPARE